MARSRVIVSYDISDDKRRSRVHRTLMNFGDRLQFSLFQCDLTARELVALRAALHPHLNHAEDQVLFVELGPADGTGAERIDAVGRPYAALVRVRIV